MFICKKQASNIDVYIFISKFLMHKYLYIKNN